MACTSAMNVIPEAVVFDGYPGSRPGMTKVSH